MNFNAIIALLSKFINADKLGGWVRAGVASAFAGLLTHYAAKYPILSGILSPEVQEAVGVAVAGAVVGYWSQVTKTDTAKLAMAADIPDAAKKGAFDGIPDSAKIAAVTALPDVEKIVVQPQAADGVGAALADPTQTKVVTQ